MANPYSIDNPKVDYRNQKKPDNTEDYNDRVEIGPTDLAFKEWQAAGITPPDMPALREYRLSKIKQELARNDYAGILLFDPVNIRYATDTSNMQVWCLHNFARACFIATDGPCVLWDFMGCDHLSDHLPLVNELRSGASFFYFESGNRVDEKAKEFILQVKELLMQHGGKNQRLAIDKMEIAGVKALLSNSQIEIQQGQNIMEDVRCIKNENELRAVRCASYACEQAVKEMRQALEPGMSESEIWSYLHAGNIKRGGEWIETRLMASGPRTNPWYQEVGPRIIQQGDLLAFDTDMVSSYGYLCDMSRTWLCGSDTPTKQQKELYQVAYDHIMTNVEIVKAGMSFAELSTKIKPLPEKYQQQRYCVCFHGVGLCDEFPSIRYTDDLKSSGYDGYIQENMVLSVEAYVGEVGGKEGVKLENEVVVTKDSYEIITQYPFEQVLLN